MKPSPRSTVHSGFTGEPSVNTRMTSRIPNRNKIGIAILQKRSIPLLMPCQTTQKLQKKVTRKKKYAGRIALEKGCPSPK